MLYIFVYSIYSYTCTHMYKTDAHSSILQYSKHIDALFYSFPPNRMYTYFPNSLPTLTDYNLRYSSFITELFCLTLWSMFLFFFPTHTFFFFSSSYASCPPFLFLFSLQFLYIVLFSVLSLINLSF